MDTLGGLRRWFHGPSGGFRSASGIFALMLGIVAVQSWLPVFWTPRPGHSTVRVVEAAFSE